MRTSASIRLPSVAWLSALVPLALAACTVHPASRPDAEAVKAIRVLENPDHSTLERLGHVTTAVTVPESQQGDPESYARMALASEALQRFPGTSVLVEVYVWQGTHANTWEASGIAARTKGS